MDRSMSLNLIDSYWGLLKNLSADVKLKLIAKLSDSLVKEGDENQSSDVAEQFYGAWKDDKTAEELIKEVRDSRILGTRRIETLAF